ncbi:MAG: signal transduction protein, partial [Planctomycetota bacterium]
MTIADKAFIGRQPIFDQNMVVYGYELLFRSNERNAADFRDGDHATANVLLSAFADIGLDEVIGDKPAFVNLTRNLLLQRQFACLPPQRVVLEILEDIEPDDEVLAAITDLKHQGFKIALDDFVYRPELEPLLPLADIVKLEL